MILHEFGHTRVWWRVWPQKEYKIDFEAVDLHKGLGGASNISPLYTLLVQEPGGYVWWRLLGLFKEDVDMLKLNILTLIGEQCGNESGGSTVEGNGTHWMSTCPIEPGSYRAEVFEGERGASSDGHSKSSDRQPDRSGAFHSGHMRCKYLVWPLTNMKSQQHTCSTKGDIQCGEICIGHHNIGV